MKYKFNDKKLKEYYEDILTLEDWIPHMIMERLPNDFFLNLGSKVKNKKKYFDKLEEHRIENRNSKLMFEDLLDYEVDVFIRKYPYFKPLFIEN